MASILTGAGEEVGGDAFDTLAVHSRAEAERRGDGISVVVRCWVISFIRVLSPPFLKR